jgi:predicted lipid carrier protein YhbT
VISARIGVRLNIPFLQNAGTFVIKVREKQYRDLEVAMDTIKMILLANGNHKVADVLFLERR